MLNTFVNIFKCFQQIKVWTATKNLNFEKYMNKIANMNNEQYSTIFLSFTQKLFMPSMTHFDSYFTC